METSKPRLVDSVTKSLAMILLIASSLFALYTCGFGLKSALTQRSIHWAFLVTSIFLVYPTVKKGRMHWWDVCLAALAAVSPLLILFTWQKNAMRIVSPSTLEIALYILGVVIVLEATRRSMGPALPIIAIIFIVYALLGKYMPTAIQHKGFTISGLATYLYSTSEGVLGMAMGTSATYIIAFVIFGAFLAVSGAGQLFVDLSLSLTGRSRSGPAYATILSNALMGIISGSPVANVVTTGAFTLPLLKKSKYPTIDGAALLAVAAAGSMFTPPVMGAAAFLIADYLSVPYGDVIMASLVPALLFYISLFVAADVASARGGLKGVSRAELPDWKEAMKKRGILIVPIIFLVGMIVAGYSALKAAFYAVILIVVLSMVRKETRMVPKKILKALQDGSKDCLSIAAACACAGIIVGVVSCTGIGVKFSSMLIRMSANNPILALILTMIACLIMGMGLPPTAVYLIMAALTVPALISMGIIPIAAHFFVFYFSCIGCITPPVALAAFASAAVARTDAFKTGWKAFRMGLVAYIVPYMFVLNPVLLLQDTGNGFEKVLAIATALIGVIFLTYGVEGYFRGKKAHLIPRLLFLAGALLMMVPGWLTDVIGAAALVAGILLTRVFKGREYVPASEEAEAETADEAPEKPEQKEE